MASAMAAQTAVSGVYICSHPWPCRGKPPTSIVSLSSESHSKTTWSLRSGLEVFRVNRRCRLLQEDSGNRFRTAAVPPRRDSAKFDDFIDPAKVPPPEVLWEEEELEGSKKQQQQRMQFQRRGRVEEEDDDEEDEEAEEEDDEEEEEELLKRVPSLPWSSPNSGSTIAAPRVRGASEQIDEEDDDEEDWEGDFDDEEEELNEDVGKYSKSRVETSARRASVSSSASDFTQGLGNGGRTRNTGTRLDIPEDFNEEAWGADDAIEEDAEFDALGKESTDKQVVAKSLNGLGVGARGGDGEGEAVYDISLKDLLEQAGIYPLAIEGDLDAVVTGIQQDSRQVSQGDLFVCCTGFKTDGHLHAAEAVEKGASVVVASREVDLDESVKALVLVEDGNAVLAPLADAFYRRPSRNMLVVGITGTNGKTTTSYLVRSVYEAMGLKTGLLGTIMYSIGGKEMEASNTTPDAVQVQKLMASMVQQDCEACVMEVSSHALALGRTTHVDFDVALFTNLTRDHMDFHTSVEDYREAKGRLFERMQEPDRHRKVINIDDPNAQYFIDRGNPEVPIVTYGLENEQADVCPLEVSLSLFETELLVQTPKGNVELSSGLLGRHNVSNILAAIAVGIAVGASLEDIVKGIEEVDAVPGRCELIDEEQAFAVVVDYAHTPDALARLLDTIRECGPNRIITVVGCGGDRDKGKRPMMAKIATEKSDITILTSDNPRSEDQLDVIDDMLAGVGWNMEDYLASMQKGYVPPLPNRHRLYVHDARGVAVRAAVAMGEEGDAVVIAGKGHETYQIVGEEKNYFDDREECREALANVDEVRSWFNTSEIPWRLIDREERPRRTAIQ